MPWRVSSVTPPSNSSARQAEVDDLDDVLVSIAGHEHVTGFDIAVQNALLVCMLQRAAYVLEDGQAFLDAQLLTIAVLGDGDATNPRLFAAASCTSHWKKTRPPTSNGSFGYGVLISA